MSMFFRKKKIPVPEEWRTPLAWAMLALLVAGSFAAGYLLGRAETPAPIIIEQVPR